MMHSGIFGSPSESGFVASYTLTPQKLDKHARSLRSSVQHGEGQDLALECEIYYRYANCS